jgi:hypothetical protein
LITRRLHRVREMVGGPLEATGHTVRWHRLSISGYSYAHCVKRGCFTLWVMNNADGELISTPITTPGPCRGKPRRKP